jgi:hypothetical protein
MAGKFCRFITSIVACLFAALAVPCHGTWGFLPQAPPNVVTLTSLHRNNVFYVGDMMTFRLSNPSAAVTYEIRDYWGNIVEQGPAAEFIYPQVTDPGWYKLYLRGAQFQDPWGYYVGATTFVIFRNNPNFPPLPSATTWGGNGLDDGVMRGIAGIGPDRHQVDADDPTDSIASVSADIAVDNQYYTPFDPVRKRKLLCAFGNGTSNLAGVAQIVTALKDSVKYWEPRNEPNFGASATDFVNNELIPFYNTVKSIDPTLKVLGPGIVTIGPPEQGWLQEFFAAGGAKYIDGFSFHAYNNVNGDLTLTRETMDYMESVLAPYPWLERWQTEQGYAAALFGSYQPRMQGRWTMLQMMVFDQHGIPKEQNQLWYDKNGGFWQAPNWWENLDGSLNPGAPLMRIWSEELFGTTFCRALDFGCPGNKLYVGNVYGGPGKKVAAIITAGSPCETIQLTDTGDASVNLVSPFGVTRTVPVQGGQFSIPISEIPSYVEFSGSLNVVPINSGTDLALQPGTVASASGDGLYPPDNSVPNSVSKIINGVLENWYWTQTAPTHPFEDDTPQFPAWVEVDLPSPQTINNVVVYADVPFQLDGTLLDYDLQYDSGGQWVTVGTVKEPTKTFLAYTPTNQTQVECYFSDRWIFQHSFPPVTTGKIRIYVRNATWGGGATELITQLGGQTGPHNVCLREIEIYNTANPTNVTPNQAPVATGVTASTTTDTPVDIDVLDSASDPDNGPVPLHIECVGQAANGMVSKLGDHIRYIPSPSFSGTDSFTYTVSDGMASTSATANITVNAVASQYAPMGGLIGLIGQYYSDQTLTNLVLTRPDPNINFNWGEASPDPSIANQHYSVRWTGTVQPRYSQNYTFYTLSDDGARLWVNGQQLVDNWVDEAPTEASWSIPLKAGQQYPVIMEYYQNIGGSTAVLSWASGSQAKEVVPQFPTIPPLVNGGLSMVQGLYYGNTDFTNLLDTRIESSIDFDWSAAPPFPNMSQTNFSVRWTGQLLAQYSEPYTLYATSDDGLRLWINGNLVINDWNSHGVATDSATVNFQAGQYYNVQIDYYQLSGPALAQLQWSSPSQPFGTIQELPQEAWTLSHFTADQLSDPAISGPTGNASGDGMANLLKYAFDIDPMTPGGSGGPAVSFFNESGHNYMALTYRRNSAATDLSYDVQVSTTLTLGSWVSVDSPEEIMGQNPATGDLFIRRRVDVTGMPVEFMRLNVW